MGVMATDRTVALLIYIHLYPCFSRSDLNLLRWLLNRSVFVLPGRKLGNDMTTHLHWVVAFQLERQTYAVPLEQVIRIVDMVSITPLPDVDRSVAGVINVHGAIVPVVDLRRQFQLPTNAWKRHTPILLTPHREQMLGLIVDTVTQVLDVSTEPIMRVAEVLPDELPEVPLLQGLIRHASGELLLLLDLNYLFQLDQIQAVIETADRLFRAQAESPVPLAGTL